MTRRSRPNGLPDMGSRRPLSIRDDGDQLLHGQLGVLDDLDPNDPEAVALLIGYLIDELPEPWRSAVTMMSRGISYEEAAGLLEIELGRRPNRGQVWRWARYGMDQIRAWLEGTPWVGALMRDRIPVGGSVPSTDGDPDVPAVEE